MRVYFRSALALAALSSGIASATAHAAMMPGSTIEQQKIVGAYRLVLDIGPAEQMHMASGMKAACSMSGSGMGMNMGTHQCNRHVELHVYDRRTGAVVMHAMVSITLRDDAKHMSIAVPVSTMTEGSMKTYHYGNNIYAGPGRYTVLVTVNKVRTTFSVQLSR